MFLVISNPTGLIKDISNYTCYTKIQSNNISITCEQHEANAIYSSNSDNFYSLIDEAGRTNAHSIVEVDNIPQNVVIGYYSYKDGNFFVSPQKQKELEKKQSDEVRIASLETQVTDTQLALCEMFESIGG